MKPKILVFADWYLPGSKGGGSVSAISNLIALLGDEFQFYVFTRNRDNTENRPYAEIEFDQWVHTGKAKVFYTAEISIRNILRRIRQVEPAIIYLNSFFSRLTIKTLLLRKFRLLPRSAVVLAPRGEFSPAALDLKSVRKRLYCWLALASGLYESPVWQASSEQEKEYIHSCIRSSGGQATVLVAPDVPSSGLLSRTYSPQRPRKETGSARIVFLSRIARIKNLEFALEVLGSARGNIELDIYGAIEDRGYWEQCQERIRRLPDRVQVHYKGPAPSDQVVQIFSEYHFQILPTLGENFGYVILEAFAGGCPVLISDQTPWRDLPKRGIGWDIALKDRGRWLEALVSCVEMDQGTYEVFSRQSRSFFEEWISTTPYRLCAKELFDKALEISSKAGAPPALERPVGVAR
jgi:glycosyltransferase involved in cell wall biosynthesis